jgi:hypothetical protein
MSEPKAWSIDISLVTDFGKYVAGPTQLSLSWNLYLARGSLVAFMDMGNCCGLGVVRKGALVVLPVTCRPNLVVTPQYESQELQADELAVIVRERLGLAAALPAEATS